jgi:peroxiredoxin Q/BCP
MQMKFLVLAALAGLLTALVQDDPKSGSKRPVPPTVGQPAPLLRLNDHTGRIATVGGERESWSVLAFYPKASTPGCTSEVCSLRDSFETLDTIGAEVYGISLDSVQDQAAFAEKQGLNFPLLSDPDASAAQKYGVLDASGQYTQRVTFVIDDKGILRRIVDQVSVKTHGEDLAALIEELRGE